MENKCKIEINSLKTQQMSVLETIYKEGSKHLKYYHATMSIFKHPEKRVKCYDTDYYEKVLPIIIPIIRSHKLINTLIKENE